jgi:hypothetical protein
MSLTFEGIICSFEGGGDSGSRVLRVMVVKGILRRAEALLRMTKKAGVSFIPPLPARCRRY